MFARYHIASPYLKLKIPTKEVPNSPITPIPRMIVLYFRLIEADTLLIFRLIAQQVLPATLTYVVTTHHLPPLLCGHHHITGRHAREGVLMRGAWLQQGLAALTLALLLRAELRAQHLERQVVALTDRTEAAAVDPARHSTTGRSLESVQLSGDSVQHTASAAGTALSFSTDEDISFSAGGSEVATLSSAGNLAVSGGVTVGGVKMTGAYAIYQEQTYGGTSDQGWNERELTTEVKDPDGIGAVNGNGITLAKGTYHVVGYAGWGWYSTTQGEHYTIKVHTSTSTLAAGSTNYATTDVDTFGYVHIDDFITLASSDTIYLSSYHTRGRQNYGMGAYCPSDSSVTCHFAQLRIQKISG